MREVFFDTEDLLKGFVAQRPEVYSPAVASVVLAQLNAVGGAGGADGDMPLFGFDASALRPKVRALRTRIGARRAHPLPPIVHNVRPRYAIERARRASLARCG